MPVPFKRNDPQTYATVLKSLYPSHGGLQQHFKLGHCQAVWDLRQMEKIARVHEIWHGTENLIVSQDGVTVALGGLDGTERGTYKSRSWLHFDQSPTDSREKCLQSSVTGNDVGIGSATFRFLEKSHLFHAEFAEHFNLVAKEYKKDYFKLSAAHVQWFKSKGCEDTCLTCEEGTQIFWDSRTVHSGIEALPLRTLPTRHDSGVEVSTGIRLVAYICYQPDMLSSANRLKRKRIMEEGDPLFLRCSSHWPNKMKVFTGAPNTWGGTLPKVADLPKPVLTERGERLAFGYA